MFCAGNKLRRAALCIFAAVFCFVLPASATVSAAADKTLTLICRRDDTILSGMRWKLYKVGERSEASFVLTGDFAGYSIDLGDMSEESVSAAAKTLESYAIADQITPLAQGQTDKNGELLFGELDIGLYLAIGKVLQVGTNYYVPSALLIEVGDEDSSFSYDAYPKFFYGDLDSADAIYIVRKVWVDDDDSYQARPVNVTVDLFCDDVLDDTVVLGEDNNWEYRWISLDPLREWRVVERDIPVDYEVLIDYNETQFLIKNSYKYIQTTTQPTTTANQQTQTTAVSGSNQTTDNKLAQTGQLWWPIIPLSCGGLLLLYGGIRLRRKENNA